MAPLGVSFYLLIQHQGRVLSAILVPFDSNQFMLCPWPMLFFQKLCLRYWMLGAGALGRPRGMVWGGRREEGSGWGTHVYLWRIHLDIWQN